MATFTFNLEDSYFDRLSILKRAEALKDPDYSKMSFNSYAELLLMSKLRQDIQNLRANDPELYEKLKKELEEE